MPAGQHRRSIRQGFQCFLQPYQGASADTAVRLEPQGAVPHVGIQQQQAGAAPGHHRAACRFLILAESLIPAIRPVLSPEFLRPHPERAVIMVAGKDVHLSPAPPPDFLRHVQHQNVFLRMGIVGIVPQQQYRVHAPRGLHNRLQHRRVLLGFLG